jgi:cell division protein ZapA
MSENNRIIKVHIFGEDYPIKGDFEDETEAERFRQHVLEVARYVDKRMHEIAERSANRSPKNIAVLTALNIADELLKLDKEKEAQLSSIYERTDVLIDRLDERLTSAPSG